MWVTKKNGSLQRFNSAKISRGCTRAGASKEVAHLVEVAVRKHARNKMRTRQIGLMVIASLRKHDRYSAEKFSKRFHGH
ncbi:MAG TPA: ATP cone domain-containing protein [archaeon]|nr:ATP cone domain-containing protein [archaeon]